MANVLKHIVFFMLVILLDFSAFFVFLFYCNYEQFSNLEFLVFIPLSFFFNIVLAMLLPLRKLGKYSWIFITNAFINAGLFAFIFLWSIH